MKIVSINTVTNNSTGRIMHMIQRSANDKGNETLAIVGRRKVYEDLPCVKCGNGISFWIHVAITTAFDRQGYGSYFSTRKIVKRLREENPDIIHLHNIHGYYINLPVLFKYLTEEFAGRVIWTFHDCWPVTGHCPHFVIAKCDKWKIGCYSCPNKGQYPISLIMDSSKRNYSDKKSMFNSLKDLTIVTPSEWMANQIRVSYMKDYPIKVIPNGIDTELFDYNGIKENHDEICSAFGIPADKKIILGVASQWDMRKGLKDIMDLTGILPEEYQIVLVGLNKKQLALLPKNITGVTKVKGASDIAKLYSAAAVFINPSMEESFSLVTVEAQCCGTPTVVLDTSAVKELVNDDNGVVLHRHEPQDYLDAIRTIEGRNYSREAVRNTAVKYNNQNMTDMYLKLYYE